MVSNLGGSPATFAHKSHDIISPRLAPDFSPHHFTPKSHFSSAKSTQILSHSISERCEKWGDLGDVGKGEKLPHEGEVEDEGLGEAVGRHKERGWEWVSRSLKGGFGTLRSEHHPNPSACSAAPISSKTQM